MYKVVQIWPGLIVCKQVTVCPGHIWTTLYFPKFKPKIYVFFLLFLSSTIWQLLPVLKFFFLPSTVSFFKVSRYDCRFVTVNNNLWIADTCRPLGIDQGSSDITQLLLFLPLRTSNLSSVCACCRNEWNIKLFGAATDFASVFVNIN